jgi:hypothetical protein
MDQTTTRAADGGYGSLDLDPRDRHGRTEREILHEAAADVLKTQMGWESRLQRALRLDRAQSRRVMQQLQDLDLIWNVEVDADGFAKGVVQKTEHMSDFVHAAINGAHLCRDCAHMEHPGVEDEACVLCAHCPECTARALILEHLAAIGDVEAERDAALDRAAAAEAELQAVETFLTDPRPTPADAPALVRRLAERVRRVRLDLAWTLIPAGLLVGFALGAYYMAASS